MSTPPEDIWLETVLGEQVADALWPHLAIAEMDRLIALYGYPKDNVIPPHLTERLRERRFADAITRSILDDDPDDPDNLIGAVQRLSAAVSLQR